MSQTAITLAFEQWKAQQAADGGDVVLDEFVFANVPGLDASADVDRAEQLPDESLIVYRQSVTRTGRVNDNAVVYSVVMGAEVGDFDFNWIGLTNKTTGTLAMIVHAPMQQKIKTAEGQQGNVLTRSFLMEYNGAQAETSINTPAETWQIDFTARMGGMDERQRLENMDIYGAAAFFGDGWLVSKKGAQYSVEPGIGYVRGLRASLAASKNITVTTKPVKVWVDVCWKGLLTSTWDVESTITVAESLVDYDDNGTPHFVFALASIDADGVVTDLRPKGTTDSQQGNNDFLRKDGNLSDIASASDARASLELGTAAIHDVTTSKNDVTPGRVMLTGSSLSLRTVKANNTNAEVANTNDLPSNSVSFVYSGAANSPGITGSLLDFTGLNGGYSTQIVGSYSNGKAIRFRTYNGDVKAWNAWYDIYHTGNKPTASDVGALSLSGGTLTGQISLPITGRGSFASQNTVGAPVYQSINTAGASEYWPIVKQHYVQGNLTWSAGMLVKDGRFCLHYIDSAGGAQTFNFYQNGQFVPGSYANFDARYQLKGTYAKPNTYGISGSVMWWKCGDTGVIRMTGTTANVSNSGRVTFPFAFPSKCYSVVANRNNSTGNAAAMQPYSISTTGWYLRIAGGGTETITWIAEGR
jgi:hypothetical protein